MALTRADIIKYVVDQTGYTKQKATIEDVMISGFCKFMVKHKAERKGRKPATGGDIVIPPR